MILDKSYNDTNFITPGRTQTDLINFYEAYHARQDKSQGVEKQETVWGDKPLNPKHPSIEWTSDGCWYEKREGLPPTESELEWDELLGNTKEYQKKQECDSDGTFGEKPTHHKVFQTQLLDTRTSYTPVQRPIMRRTLWSHSQPLSLMTIVTHTNPISPAL